MAIPSKIHIQSAVDKSNSHCRVDLSRKMLTTCKIGQILPIFHEALVPGDKIRVNLGNFARFMPMPVPAYVKLDFKTLAVFVPYHQVSDGIESYFANQKVFKGITAAIPQITDYAFGVAFSRYIATNSGWTTTVGASATNYDVVVGTNYYLLTAKGRYAMKVLANLGYNFYHHTFDGTLTANAYSYNALPLLSFLHAYNSYMSYAPEYNTSALSLFLETVKRTPSTTITGNQIYDFIGSVLLTFDSNIITSCWKEPYASNDINAMSSAPYQTLNQNSLTVTQNHSFDSNINVNSGEGATDTMQADLSAQQIRMLLQFDEYFRRTNYGGSKDIEQIYSRFGVKIDDYKCRYPYFLQSSSSEVKIGDVTSTSQTEVTSSGTTTGAPLGAYAGKAIGDGGVNFSFDCHDYGMIFVFGWFAPRVQYIRGIDKECLRIQPLDFYNPEFDYGYADPLRLPEVNNSVPSKSAYGYIPLYSQYLYANDIISGDFRTFAGMDTWHFGRLDWSQYVTAQSDLLVYMPNTGTEYERIFNVDPQLVDVDTIYCDVRADVVAMRPMKDFSGKSMLGVGSLDLPTQGTMIN